MRSGEKRISNLETGIEDFLTPGNYFQSLENVVEALEEVRLKAARGEPLPETPITREMMDHPVHGKFYRLMHEAQERVRKFRENDLRNK